MVIGNNYGFYHFPNMIIHVQIYSEGVVGEGVVMVPPVLHGQDASQHWHQENILLPIVP